MFLNLFVLADLGGCGGLPFTMGSGEDKGGSFITGPPSVASFVLFLNTISLSMSASLSLSLVGVVVVEGWSFSAEGGVSVSLRYALEPPEWWACWGNCLDCGGVGGKCCGGGGSFRMTEVEDCGDVEEGGSGEVDGWAGGGDGELHRKIRFQSIFI